MLKINTGIKGSLFKTLMLLIFIVLLSGCATTKIAVKNNASFSQYRKVYLYVPQEDPRKVFPKVRERLEKLGFQVICVEEGEPIGGRQGSGFIITPDGYVLTSGHVIGDKREATLWVDGKRYEADLICIELDKSLLDKQNKDNKKSKDLSKAMSEMLNSENNQPIENLLKSKDIALLKIRNAKTSFVPLSFASDPEYRMGADVYTIGFPLSHILGDKPRLTKGIISSSVGIRDNPNFVQISVEVQPGNSGGPLLNEKGQVIGMVQMTLNPMAVLSRTKDSLPQNVNFALKESFLKEFLRNCSEKANLVLREGESISLEQVQQSVAQIRSGIIPEEFRQEKKLVCLVRYSYLWDMWFRFSFFDVTLYDLDTEEILLRAGQYGDNPMSSENSTIDNVFRQIASKMGK